MTREQLKSYYSTIMFFESRKNLMDKIEFYNKVIKETSSERLARLLYSLLFSLNENFTYTKDHINFKNRPVMFSLYEELIKFIKEHLADNTDYAIQLDMFYNYGELNNFVHESEEIIIELLENK